MMVKDKLRKFHARLSICCVFVPFAIISNRFSLTNTMATFANTTARSSRETSPPPDAVALWKRVGEGPKNNFEWCQEAADALNTAFTWRHCAEAQAFISAHSEPIMCMMLHLPKRRQNQYSVHPSSGASSLPTRRIGSPS